MNFMLKIHAPYAYPVINIWAFQYISNQKAKQKLQNVESLTTEQLYGECLHSYTIKEAIKDEAVLGFLVENIGVKDMTIAEEEKSYL